MTFIKPYLSVTNLLTKNLSALSTAEMFNLRKKLQQHNIKLPKYRDILDQYRIKTKDMKIMRTPAKVRPHPSMRNQTHQRSASDDYSHNSNYFPVIHQVCGDIFYLYRFINVDSTQTIFSRH